MQQRTAGGCGSCTAYRISLKGGILDYCRKKKITMQAWSPFQISLREGSFIDSDRYPELNQALEEIAQTYGTTKTGIAAAGHILP